MKSDKLQYVIQLSFVDRGDCDLLHSNNMNKIIVYLYNYK